MVQSEDWDSQASAEYYRHISALKQKSILSKGFRQKNQLPALVNAATSSASELDERLARVNRSKAQVRSKYGW